MNRRQKLKRLKRDNNLMRQIIKNTPEMEGLYQAYNEPVKNITHTTMTFQRLKGYQTLPVDTDITDMDGRIIEAYREVLADELCKLAKDYIHYDFNKGTYFMPRLEGSLYVGIKV